MTDPPAAPEPGPIETAVEADLQMVGAFTKAGQRTLAAMARKLARVLDARGDDEPASQTAKAIETLRITMAQITAGDQVDPDAAKKLGAILSTPGDGGSSVSPALRYPPKSRTAHPGPGGGEDRDGAG